MRSHTRALAVLFLAAAAAGPRVDAQQAPKIAKIGYLAPATPVELRDQVIEQESG